MVIKVKNLVKTCSALMLLMFICCFLLLLFSYTDSLSLDRIRLQAGNVPIEILDDFAVENFWTCQDDRCVKVQRKDASDVFNTLESCNMLCWQPPLWPKPKSLQVANRGFSCLDTAKISFNLVADGPAKIMLTNATDLFVKSLKESNCATNNTANITITISDGSLWKLKLNTSENYKLKVRKDGDTLLVLIFADNFFGARHGLETLSQLIWYDVTLLILHDVDVEDSPKFPYRGLMVDTARNFFPVDQLKRVVDGMAMSKLNVLHLHLTDAVSFPLVLPSFPQLAGYGAYGPGMIYAPQDVRDLVVYSRVRGVRLLLEVDAPGHVNAGWNHLQRYIICGEDDVFNGHLNPDNEDVLQVLETIYGDLLELSDEDELFHVGADEVNLTCWKDTKAARNYSDMKSFWASYTNRMIGSLKRAHRNYLPKVILWSSPLTESTNLADLDDNVVVQVWLGNPSSALRRGHQVIYSMVGHWYLDCGFGPWKSTATRGVCDPYTPWQTFYNYRPWEQFKHQELTLGGEVCLWSEQVEVDTLETRIWPRSAAFAERVWRDPEEMDAYDVHTRLAAFRDRLLRRGLKVAAMWPRWCSQNPGKC